MIVFHHLRRIVIVLAIFITAGWLFKMWREPQGGYGLFELLNNKKASAVGFQSPESLELSDHEVPSLKKLNEESAHLAAAVLPCVVSIDTATVRRERLGIFPAYQSRVVAGKGSGAIVSKEGLVITNNHVIAGTNEIVVTTNDQKTYQAEVVGADTRLDIAILKILGGKKDFPTLGFADSDKVKAGQMVFAVGNPFGFSGTVTQGIISATQRRLTDLTSDLLQTDTVINPGNSGGPLLNINGRIVGVNVSIVTGDQTPQEWQGVGFAVPANDARAALETIIKQGPPTVGYLGISLQQNPVAVGSVFSATLGVVIDQVQAGSPAEKAGMKPGDVIAAINGQALTSPDHVFLVVRGTPPGSQINFTVVRGGKASEMPVTILARPGA